MKTISLFKILITTVLLCMLISCTNEDPISNINSKTVLASYQDGALTVEEFESFLFNLPAQERWNDEVPLEFFKTLIKKYIANKKLLNEAQLIAIEQDPELKNQIRTINRDLLVNQYISSLDEYKTLESDKLEQFYENNIAQFQLPERRQVYHIFVSSNSNEINDAKLKIESLRTRLLNGESIKLLAKEHSDSETRHNNGYLGLIKAGEKSEDFDSVVFKLEKNEPSEVIKSLDGFHIFVVTDILMEKKYDIDSVKNILKNRYIKDYSLTILKEVASKQPQPESLNILSNEELALLMRSSKPGVNLLEVGDFNFTTDQFMHLLIKESANKTVDEMRVLAPKLIKEIAYKEVIYQSLSNQNYKFHKPNYKQQIIDLAIIDKYSQIKMRTYVNNYPELINEYYTNNQKRFSSPIRLKLQRLMIKKSDHPNLMPELEASIEALDIGGKSIQQLAELYKGNIQNIGLSNTQQLSQLDPNILKFALLLKNNEHSPPYTNNNFFIIDKLLERKDPKIMPLAKVREAVIDNYINRNKADIFEKINIELMKDIIIDEKLLDSFIHNQSSI